MIPFPSQAELQSLSSLKTMNDMLRFRMACAFKTEIQNAILAQISQQEKSDIRYSRYNENVVDKLVSLGAQKFAAYNSVEALYCAAMAVGTIIKEYEWGIQFVTGDGVYQMARRIYNAAYNV